MQTRCCYVDGVGGWGGWVGWVLRTCMKPPPNPIWPQKNLDPRQGISQQCVWGIFWIPYLLLGHPAIMLDALGDAVFNCPCTHGQDHRINWKETKLIAPVQFWLQRRVREAIEIKSHNTVPQDIGFYINDIWSPLLKPTLPTAAHHNTDTLHRTHIQPATNSHASPGKHNLNPSRPNVRPSSPT